MGDPTYEQWQNMSRGERGNAISNDPGLAFRMDAARGQSSTDSASPYRFQDPNNQNPTPGSSVNTWGLEPGYTYDGTGSNEKKPFTEHDRLMAQAYSPQSYYGGKGIGGYQAEQLDNFLKGLGSNQPVDDGGAAARAAQIKAMIDAINATYDRQKGSLDTNKATSLGGITSAYDAARGGIDRNLNDYNASAERSQAAMTQRIADQLAQMQTRSSELQNSAQLMGQGTGALQAQSAGNMEALKASSGLQEDLSRRMAEVISNNSRMAQNSGDLVKQGATGTLETNYNSLLNALMTQREQSLLDAQTGGSSGGSGGGGGSSSDKMTAAELKAMREQGAIDSAWGSGDANTMLASLFQSNPDYAAYLTGLDAPEGQDPTDWMNSQIGSALQGGVSQPAMQKSLYEKYLSNMRGGYNQ